MSGADREQNQPPADLDALRAARTEARETLDQQLTVLREIDDKAMRTVRINVLLLGVGATAAAVAPEEVPQSVWVYAGGVSLLVSMLSATATYTVSNPEVGVGPEYLEDVRTEAYSEAGWQETVIAGYQEWVGDLAAEIEQNAALLEVSLYALALGLVCFGAAVVQAPESGLIPL